MSRMRMVVEDDRVVDVVPFQDGDDPSLEVFPTENPAMFRTLDGDFLIMNWEEMLARS